MYFRGFARYNGSGNRTIPTVKKPERWDVDNPVLYTAESKLIRRGKGAG